MRFGKGSGGRLGEGSKVISEKGKKVRHWEGSRMRLAGL